MSGAWVEWRSDGEPVRLSLSAVRCGMAEANSNRTYTECTRLGWLGLLKLEHNGWLSEPN